MGVSVTSPASIHSVLPRDWYWRTTVARRFSPPLIGLVQPHGDICPLAPPDTMTVSSSGCLEVFVLEVFFCTPNPVSPNAKILRLGRSNQIGSFLLTFHLV